MEQNTTGAPESDLPAGIGNPARRALAAAGYLRLEQLTGVREAELLKLHGVGPKALEVIRQALAARGQSLAEAASGERQNKMRQDGGHRR